MYLESGYKADFYLLGEDPFIFGRWNRVGRNAAIAEMQLPVAPPEYVIASSCSFTMKAARIFSARYQRHAAQCGARAQSSRKLNRWIELLRVQKTGSWLPLCIGKCGWSCLEFAAAMVATHPH